MEYIEIVVTARQRGLDLREIGLLSLKGRPPLLRHLDEATLLTDTHRMALASEPAMLSDGGSRSAGIDLDSAIDEFHGHAGSEYAYVLASGTIYLKKTKVLTQPEELQVHQGPPHRAGVDITQFAQHFRVRPPFGAVVAEELQYDYALCGGLAVGVLIGGHLRFLLGRRYRRPQARRESQSDPMGYRGPCAVALVFGATPPAVPAD
jgi:hypothetical protein